MPETLSTSRVTTDREYARGTPEIRPESGPRLLRTGYPRRRGGTAPGVRRRRRPPRVSARRTPAAAFVSIKRKKQKAAFSHHKTRHTAT